MVGNKNDQKKERPWFGKYYRISEVYLWFFSIFLILSPGIYSLVANRLSDSALQNFSTQFIFAFLFFLFPFLFRLISDKLPIEYIRDKILQENKTEETSDSWGNITSHEEIDYKQYSKYLIQCINESKMISEKIFSRSAIYLSVGCFIAVIGIAVFSSSMVFPKSTSDDISRKLVEDLPRFGALFFIEFIAIFFLKQYRVTLEEYRYYEATKRKRQDMFNLIVQVKNDPDLVKLIEPILANFIQTNGMTTEFFKPQKIIDNDLDIFSKFIELVKEVKK